MLKVDLDEKESIAILEPSGALCENDFGLAVKAIDPFIEKTGKLEGIIIYVESFPGWESFSALLKHLKFIKEYHKKVSSVAFVTNSAVGEIAEHVGSHFVNAKIKIFSFDELEDAKKWIEFEKIKEAIHQSGKISDEEKSLAVQKIEEGYVEDRGMELLSNQLLKISKEINPILEEMGLL
jgi:DNA primase large subunit